MNEAQQATRVSADCQVSEGCDVFLTLAAAGIRPDVFLAEMCRSQTVGGLV